ncbi:MAG: helix-turn-helix domain-containing protein [Planctomycetes bacterium]|nr:helix-turn-helix domain-containing protein [Planctomycetota bacterium]MCB9903642.1 helix-turn-helix domain-containing protein [Planctomycetota bacterium]
MTNTEADTQYVDVFPPGEFIKDEMLERGWSQADLAEIIGKSPKLVSEILSGKRSITPETAASLGAAFGEGDPDSAQVWLNLESRYRLSRIATGGGDVSRRARLYEKAPVKEMVRRGWLRQSNDVDALERDLLCFLGIDSTDDDPTILAAARAKGSWAREWTPAQQVWFVRVAQLGSMVNANRYSAARLRSAMEQLKALIPDAENVRLVPRLLADAGVRLVVVEHTSGSRIDGATLWLDPKSPVVGLSMRYDRIDYFWHTLFHELAHVRQGKRASGLDIDLAGPDSDREDWSDIEVEADTETVSGLVPQDALTDFIRRVRPLYSQKKILGFAAKCRTHPAIVLGQLKHRGEIPWKNMARLHVKVREYITDSALTDGWGHMAPGAPR